jgi:hypothetical protein
VILQELGGLYAVDDDGGDDCLQLSFIHLLNQQPKSYYKINDKMITVIKVIKYNKLNNRKLFCINNLLQEIK